MTTWNKMFQSSRVLRLAMNVWPPFVGAGIEIEAIDSDFCRVQVALKSTIFNRNYVGTHFGGSLFAMTDPFYMLMVIRNLGPKYFVWDRSAHIEFIAPGKGRVRSEMRISSGDLQAIRDATAGGSKYERDFVSEVFDAEAQLIARVQRKIYVRLKPEFRPKEQT